MPDGRVCYVDGVVRSVETISVFSLCLIHVHYRASWASCTGTVMKWWGTTPSARNPSTNTVPVFRRPKINTLNTAGWIQHVGLIVIRSWAIYGGPLVPPIFFWFGFCNFLISNKMLQKPKIKSCRNQIGKKSVALTGQRICACSVFLCSAI